MNENTINKKIRVGDIKLGDLEKKYLSRVIDSNQLSYGFFSKKFEEEIAKAHSCEFAVFSNSGTSALLAALLALKEKYKWNDGDEVIVPALTFIATSNIVIQANMVPIFVDADEKTYNINPSLIEQKISSKTRCIIPVHMFGLPCEMDPILDIAKKHNLRIIEDSCETMFASYKGKKVGSFGDFGCFSTYVAHYIVTGVGGLTITNDANLNNLVRSIMNHGRNMDIKWFSFDRMGYSFRCTELEAAIGLAQVEQKDEIIKKRTDNAHFYKDKLAPLEQHITLPFEPKDRTHSFMMFPILVKGDERKELVAFLEKNNIETRDMPTVINQPYYRNIFPQLVSDNFPVTKNVMNKGFYIGTHQYITEQEREYIINKFFEFYYLNKR